MAKIRSSASSSTGSGRKNDGSQTTSNPSVSSSSWITPLTSEIRSSSPASATFFRAIASDGSQGSSPTTVTPGNVRQRAMARPATPVPDVEDPRAVRDEVGRGHELRDHARGRALRLQQHGIVVRPGAGTARILHQLDRLGEVRASERDQHGALAVVERLVRLASAECVDHAVELLADCGIRIDPFLVDPQPGG